MRNGLDGIMAVNGGYVSLTNLNVHDNLVFGISLQDILERGDYQREDASAGEAMAKILADAERLSSQK